MTEPQLFETIGRLQISYNELHGNYVALVAVLRGIKDGSVVLDRLTVNADGTWSLAAGAVE